MKKPPAILVVDDTVTRSEIVNTLRDGGYRVTSVGTFEQATDLIASDPPDVLITELRLGAFNGLHLVIRSRSHNPKTVAIIHTAFPDPVLEAEARRLGAEFLARPVEPAALLTVVSQRLRETSDRRAYPRKQASGSLEVEIAGRRASLVDLSYEGFQIELPEGELPSPFEIRLPSYGVSVKAKVVWAHRSSTRLDTLLCGATVSELDETTAPAWRRAVDAT